MKIIMTPRKKHIRNWFFCGLNLRKTSFTTFAKVIGDSRQKSEKLLDYENGLSTNGPDCRYWDDFELISLGFRERKGYFSDAEVNPSLQYKGGITLVKKGKNLFQIRREKPGNWLDVLAK